MTEDSYTTIRTVATARRLFTKRIGCCCLHPVVKHVYGFETRAVPLRGIRMRCETSHVSSRSLQDFKERTADAPAQHDRATVGVETADGAIIDLPVLCDNSLESVNNYSGPNGGPHSPKIFVDISSLSSQDNTCLRDLDSGELLVPQPENTCRYAGSAGKRNGGHGALRNRLHCRRRVVVLGKREGRYQLIAVALEKAVV